jgi:hypothetical protein
MKNIKELTKTVAGSLPVLKSGVKSSLVMDEINNIGLITELVTTALMCPLYPVLNSTLFLGEEL